MPLPAWNRVNSRYYSTCVIIVNLYVLRLLNIGIHLFQSSKVKSEFVPACLWNPCPYPKSISIYTYKFLNLYSLELNSVWKRSEEDLIGFDKEARKQKQLLETDLKTDIRRFLATDVAARRLKLDTETGTAQSSVQTNKQQDPFRKIWQTKSGPSSDRRYHPADRLEERLRVIQENRRSSLRQI